MTASLTTMQAIRQVLEQADGPLKAGEVADKVIPLVPGLKGKTPKATVAAKLYVEAKKAEPWIGKVDGGFVLIKREGGDATAATRGKGDSAAVIPGSKVVRDGKAKPDPKPSSKRKAKATA